MMARRTARFTSALFSMRLFRARFASALFTARFFTARFATARFTFRLAAAFLMAFRGTFPSFGLARGSRERPRATLPPTMGWMDSLAQ